MRSVNPTQNKTAVMAALERVGAISTTHENYLPRMECARPGAEAKTWCHTAPPIHMCSALRGGA